MTPIGIPPYVLSRHDLEVIEGGAGIGFPDDLSVGVGLCADVQALRDLDCAKLNLSHVILLVS